jgi:hypothetical protein
MRLIKILAIAVAVLIVFWVASALLHVLYLIAIGFVIAAAIFLAFKGWEQYKHARQRHDERRAERTRERAERRPARGIEARRAADPDRAIEARPQQPGSLPAPGTYDIDEELARLRRDMN